MHSTVISLAAMWRIDCLRMEGAMGWARLEAIRSTRWLKLFLRDGDGQDQVRDSQSPKKWVGSRDGHRVESTDLEAEGQSEKS